MKNITLALTILLGFCATEAVAQARSTSRPNLLNRNRNRPAAAPAPEEVKTAPQESPEERALREKKEAEEKAERELWSTWPRDVSYWDANIVKACEQKLDVVFYGENNDGWMQGCGKCLIDRGSSRRLGGRVPWKKFNPDGVLIQAGECVNFKEYVWMTNCAAYATAELRKKWSEEHGMSYEEAVRKVEARKEKAKPNLLKSARSEKDIEREKQIVEALRKMCAAEKAKEEK